MVVLEEDGESQVIIVIIIIKLLVLFCITKFLLIVFCFISARSC